MKLFKNMKVLAVTALAAIFAISASVFAISGPTPPGGTTIESDLGVLNATAGQKNYVNSVNARVDEVVNIQVWYHNREDENSGKTADNVNVRVALPGARQNSHTITSTVQGSNTNYDTEVATVSTSIPTNLQYVAGSAVRRYNAGTNANPNWVSARISDSVVGSGYTIPVMQPCWNFQESIILQARVMAPVLSIVKQVKIEGATTWQTNTQAQAGDTLAYLITVKNEGNTQLNNVIVRDSLPPRLLLVPGSVQLFNANHRSGITVSDNLTNGGVNAGNYTPGSDVKIRFQARIPADQTGCNLTFTNVAVARADGLGEYYNTAIAQTSCRPLESRIRIIKFNDVNGNRTQDAEEARLSGWQFRVTGPNGFSQTVTTDANGEYLLTSLAAGNYTVTEITKEGWINTTGLSLSRDVALGETEVYTFGNRQVQPPVNPPSGGGDTPAALPTSGPAEAAGAAAASMTLSGGVLAWIRSKKNLLSALRK